MLIYLCIYIYIYKFVYIRISAYGAQGGGTRGGLGGGVVANISTNPNQIFKLLSRKFDLAIEFLDKIGNSRIKKGYNNSLVNNAVYENKDLAKNIRILYDLWIEFTKWNSKYSSSFKNADKSELQNQASIIEDKKQEYSQKMFEKQKYVNYKQ